MAAEPATDRRGAIVQTASRLFAEQGYGSVGMRAIADAVGVRASSLYHHFPSKLDLLYAVSVVATEGFIDEQLPVLEGPGSAAGRLSRVLRAHILYFHEHRLEEAVGLRELARLRDGAPERYEYVQGRRRAYQHAIAHVIGEGAEAGELDVADPALAALAVLGLVNSINTWFDPDGARSIDEVADLYVELCVGRLLSVPAT